jgi:hypothetical protein
VKSNPGIFHTVGCYLVSKSVSELERLKAGIVHKDAGIRNAAWRRGLLVVKFLGMVQSREILASEAVGGVRKL